MLPSGPDIWSLDCWHTGRRPLRLDVGRVDDVLDVEMATLGIMYAVRPAATARTAVVVTAVGAAFIAAPIPAEARCVGDSCKRPISSTNVSTTYKYNTVRRVQNVTRYRNVTRLRHVTNVNRVVHVTRIQPVTRVNTVTRVHYRTVVLNEAQRAARTRILPARSASTGKTVNMGGNIPAPKVNTTYRYNTVQKVNNVTRYNDVYRTRYVKRRPVRVVEAPVSRFLFPFSLFVQAH